MIWKVLTVRAFRALAGHINDRGVTHFITESLTPMTFDRPGYRKEGGLAGLIYRGKRL
jgi:hypothetical protein